MYKTSLLAASVAASLSLPAAAQVSQIVPGVQVQPHAAGLETVVIVSSRAATDQRQLGSSVSVLDASDIQSLGFPNLSDSFRSLPSVSVTNSGGVGRVSSMRVRGEAGFRTLVRVDGVDITDPTGPQSSSQIQHLLSANVARVELLRGPQGMMYGADAGGVVDITTGHVTEGIAGGARYESGRYHTENYSAHMGGGNERGDFTLSGARVNTDGFNARVEDASGAADGYDNTTWHARAGLNFGENVRAEAVLRDTRGKGQYDQCGFPDLQNDCLDDFQQRNMRLSLTHTDERTGSHTMAFSSSEVDRTDYEQGIESYAVEGDIGKFELNGQIPLNPKHTVAYGFEHRADSVGGLSRDQRGVYVELQGAYAPDVFVTLGARHDHNEDFGSHASYRVSLAHLLGEFASGTLKAKASVSTGFRAPSLFEIDNNRQWAPEGTPDLGPEESRGFEAGLEYFRPNGVRIEWVLFNQKITEEIYYDSNGFFYAQGDDSQSRGIEWVAEMPLSAQLDLNVNYTYVDAESEDGSPRSRQPKHLGNLGLQFRATERWDMSLYWRTARDNRDGAVPLDNYQVVDASTRYRLAQGLVVFARVENALDEDYVEVINYNTPGAAAYAGVELSF